LKRKEKKKMSNESINGKGIHLVNEAEGIVPIPSPIHPWEVAGEKEALEGTSMILGIMIVEGRMISLYNHTLECKEPNCDSKIVFDRVMTFRRDFLFPMLKADLHALYEANYALLGIYLATKGNENVFVEKVLEGLTLSMFGK
jgi:hypothetical protein